MCFQCNCCTVPLYMLLPRIERLSVPPRRTDITEHVKTDEDTFSVGINYNHHKPNSCLIFYWVSPTLYIPRTCSSFMVLHELFQLNVLSFYLSLLIWACRALKYNSMKINCNPFYLNVRSKILFYLTWTPIFETELGLLYFFLAIMSHWIFNVFRFKFFRTAQRDVTFSITALFFQKR